MLTRLSIAAFITALGPLTGMPAAAAADEPLRLAQATDIRQEDRRADRRMDPADNREVRVPLPRNADGTIDVAALLASIDARVDAGAREIQVRRDPLTQDEARALLLAPEGRDLLVRIGALLPDDGRERNVTFRGAVDARVRVQREPDGSLRLIVRDIDTGRLTAAERAQLARDLSANQGFDRVRIRGVDADGNRIRVEFRADRGLVRNEGGDGRARQAQQDQREGRHGRDERAERTARADRSGGGDRVERIERVDRSGPSGGVERVERVERADRSGSNSGRN